jgi:hypothetical protein
LEKTIQEMKQVFEKIGGAFWKGVIAPVAASKPVSVLASENNPTDSVSYLELAKENGAYFPYDPDSAAYMSADKGTVDAYLNQVVGLTLVVGMLLAGVTTAIVMKGTPAKRRAPIRRRVAASVTRRRATVRRYGRMAIKRRTSRPAAPKVGRRYIRRK